MRKIYIKNDCNLPHCVSQFEKGNNVQETWPKTLKLKSMFMKGNLKMMKYYTHKFSVAKLTKCKQALPNRYNSD